MAFKVCVVCGTRPIDGDAPHELPSPHGHPGMRFCDSCQDVVIRTSQLRTSQGASDQTILAELWNRYGFPAYRASLK